RIAGIVKRRILATLHSDPDAFLRECRGVVHVGANEGQERDLYAWYDLNVVWIEPIPAVFERLVSNIYVTPRQRAINALITDENGKEVTLHIANNGGQSSSVLELHHHRDIWPEVRYEDAIRCRSETLPAALRSAGIDASDYDALVIDTQGSELMVLHGAETLLPGFRYIKTEAANFESYKGCATVDGIVEYLRRIGFGLKQKHCFAKRKAGGEYFDLLFVRSA